MSALSWYTEKTLELAYIRNGIDLSVYGPDDSG